MTLNTKNGLADARQIVRTVREEHVEVLTLQEANTALLQRLATAGLGSVLPYPVVAAPIGHDNGGVNVLCTAAKPVGTTGDLIAIEASSVPSACVRMSSRTVCFGSVHTFFSESQKSGPVEQRSWQHRKAAVECPSVRAHGRFQLDVGPCELPLSAG